MTHTPPSPTPISSSWTHRARRAALCAGLALGSLTMWPGAEAKAQGLCESATDVNKELQYLRRVSLDLRGKMPSIEEYEEVLANERVPREMIEQMLETPDFAHQMRQYHRDLLTVDLSTQRFTSLTLREYAFEDGSKVWTQSNGGVRRTMRGFLTATEGKGLCANQKVTLANPIVGEITGEDGKRYPLDGWVEVTPWWDKSKPIKVCAFDALRHESADRLGAHKELYYSGGVVAEANLYGGFATSAAPVDCTISNSAVLGRTRACGCGPELAWCSSTVAETMLREATAEQVLQFTDAIVAEDRPYTDIIQSSAMPYNGVLLHWMEYLSFRGGSLLVSDRDHGLIDPPSIEGQELWRDVERDARHSGVLTTPFFLLKWQSDRGRANAFYNIFMCNAFSPPTEGLPASDHPSVNEPNLTHRAGCDTCHRGLEPMASYWGHWVEAGYLPLGSEETTNAIFPSLPAVNEMCKIDVEKCTQRDTWRCVSGSNADRQLCRFFYAVGESKGAEGDAYNGYLNAYVYADVDPRAETNARVCDMNAQDCGYTENVRKGPAALAAQIVRTGEFSDCSVRRFWGHLVGRDMTRAERVELLPELSQRFTDNDYHIKQLVLELVTREEYREATWAGLQE